MFSSFELFNSGLGAGTTPPPPSPPSPFPSLATPSLKKCLCSLSIGEEAGGGGPVRANKKMKKMKKTQKKTKQFPKPTLDSTVKENASQWELISKMVDLLKFMIHADKDLQKDHIMALLEDLVQQHDEFTDWE